MQHAHLRSGECTRHRYNQAMTHDEQQGLIMDASEWANIVSPFYLAVGRVVEEFSRKTVAEIDIELLRLEREKLTEKLDDTRVGIVKAADLEKKNVVADLASRGLLGSSMKESSQKAVDNRSADVLDKLHREYNRAIEKLALLEQKIKARNRQWWLKPFRWIFGL